MSDNCAVTKKKKNLLLRWRHRKSCQRKIENRRKTVEAEVNDTINIGMDKMWRRYGRKTEMGKSNDKQ